MNDEIFNWLSARFDPRGHEIGNIALEEDFRAWATVLDVPVAMLCDRVAVHLAQGFAAKRLSFTFCDAVINGLSGVALDTGPTDLFLAIYLAFDAGEYNHSGDGPEIDPSEAYTRPMIQEVLAGQASG